MGCPRFAPLRSLMHSQGWSQPSQPRPVCVVRGWPRANGAGPRAAGTRGARALRRRSGCSAPSLSPSSKVTQPLPRAPGTAGELSSPAPPLPRREAGGEGMAIACRAKSACERARARDELAVPQARLRLVGHVGFQRSASEPPTATSGDPSGEFIGRSPARSEACCARGSRWASRRTALRVPVACLI